MNRLSMELGLGNRGGESTEAYHESQPLIPGELYGPSDSDTHHLPGEHIDSAADILQQVELEVAESPLFTRKSSLTLQRSTSGPRGTSPTSPVHSHLHHAHHHPPHGSPRHHQHHHHQDDGSGGPNDRRDYGLPLSAPPPLQHMDLHSTSTARPLPRAPTTMRKAVPIAGVRTWLKVDQSASSSIVQLERSKIQVQYGVQLRDFRVLDPVLGAAYPSCLLCRDKAIVVNLDHIKVIITSAFILVNHVDADKVRGFVEELKRRLHHYQSSPHLLSALGAMTTTSAPHLGSMARCQDSMDDLKSAAAGRGGSGSGPTTRVQSTLGRDTGSTRDALVRDSARDGSSSAGGAAGLVHQDSPQQPLGGGDGAINELVGQMPFELRALEVCLEQTVNLLDGQTTQLEKAAHVSLDQLTFRVTPKNLERVRRIKSRMVRLNTRVETIRELLEKLLDDDKAMAAMSLTAREAAEEEAALAALAREEMLLTGTPRFPRVSGTGASSSSSDSGSLDLGEDAAVVEMLLEAYFMQLDNTWNRLQALKEYIEDTEDLINLELDQQRNNLISVDLMVTFASFLLTGMSVVAGLLGMNLPNHMEDSYASFVQISVISAVVAVALWLLFVHVSIKKGLISGVKWEHED